MAFGNQRGYHSDDSSGNEYHQRDGNRFRRVLHVSSRVAERDPRHHAQDDHADTANTESVNHHDIGQIQENIDRQQQKAQIDPDESDEQTPQQRFFPNPLRVPTCQSGGIGNEQTHRSQRDHPWIAYQDFRDKKSDIKQNNGYIQPL